MEGPRSRPRPGSTQTAPPRFGSLAFTGGSSTLGAISFAECGCARSRAGRKRAGSPPDDGAGSTRLCKSEWDHAGVGARAGAQPRGRNRGRADPGKLVETSESVADFSVHARGARFEG